MVGSCEFLPESSIFSSPFLPITAEWLADSGKKARYFFADSDTILAGTVHFFAGGVYIIHTVSAISFLIYNKWLYRSYPRLAGARPHNACEGEGWVTPLKRSQSRNPEMGCGNNEFATLTNYRRQGGR